MNTLELLGYGLGASGWVLAALLGLKLKGKKPPSNTGIGHNR